MPKKFFFFYFRSHVIRIRCIDLSLKHFSLEMDSSLTFIFQNQRNRGGGGLRYLLQILSLIVGGAVASWLVSSTPDRAVRVRALAGDIVLCSWARRSTLTVHLSTQVYKPANLMLGVTLRWTSIPSKGGVAIFLVA